MLDKIVPKSRSSEPTFIETYRKLYETYEASNFENNGDILDCYYAFMNSSALIKLGWGKNFNFVTPDYIGQSKLLAHNSNYNKIIELLKISENDTLLEIGGGKSSALTFIENKIGCACYGIGIAVNKSKSIVEKDYTKIERDNFFTKAFAIYTLKHNTVNDIQSIFHSLYKTLKPGGYFLSHELLITSSYDENNQVHKRLMLDFIRNTAMHPLHTKNTYIECAKNAGFELVMDKDLSHCVLDQKLDWTYYIKIKLLPWMPILDLYQKTTKDPRKRDLAKLLSTPSKALLEGYKLGIFEGSNILVFQKI